MKYILFIIFSFSTHICFSQIQRIDSIPREGIVLNKGWKFQAGDHPEWARPDFDDSKWQSIDPTLDVNKIPQIRQQPIGWLRIRFHVDSSLLNKPLAYHVFQSIASRIYLNGTLIQSYGVVSADRTKIQEWWPSNDLRSIIFTQTEQTMAIRFSLQQALSATNFVEFKGFVFHISTIDNAVKNAGIPHQYPYQFAVYIGFYFVLSLLHFILYLNRPAKKANLYFSLTSLCGLLSSVLGLIFCTVGISLFYLNLLQISYYILFTSLYNLFLYFAIHHLFSAKRNVMYWLIIAFAVANPVLVNITDNLLLLCMFIILFISIGESTRIIYLAYKKGISKAGILLAAFCIYWILLAILIYSPDHSTNEFDIYDLIWTFFSIDIPLSLTLYLSLDFALTSKELDQKLVEVRQLSDEKQQILLSQNEFLEQQVSQRTSELNQSLYELKSAQAQLIQSEKMASLGELTAGIAHEIQNPLNFVKNFSEINNELIDEMNIELDKGDIEEAKLISNDIKENLEKIGHHGKRADAIVRGMLMHSRKSSGVKEPTDLNKLIDESIRLSYHGFRAKDKSFNSDFTIVPDETIGHIDVVPQDMGRALLNVFNNAFYAVNEKKKTADESYMPLVSVRTTRVNDKIQIIIKDNGSGISHSTIDKIFQPFFTTKPTGQGTGLGLSLVYDIIAKEHNGTIKVESKVGEGSEFVIQLS